MSEDGRRALIAAGRRVVFTGLIILGAWVLLVGLRGAAVATTAESMAEEAGVSQEAMTELLKEGDWSRSWWTDKSVAEEFSSRLGITLQLVMLGGVMALVVAAAAARGIAAYRRGGSGVRSLQDYHSVTGQLQVARTRYSWRHKSGTALSEIIPGLS